MNRQDFADAIVPFVRLRAEDLKERLSGSRVQRLSQSSAWSRDDEYHTLSYLEPSAREVYFAMVARKDGQPESDQLREDFDRIDRKDGVTIVLETSDDDPFQITAHIQDPIADAWADAHGSLDGGTWECCDGPDFVYDILSWHPGLIEELQKEGYDLDCSQLYEPGEEEMAIMKHASECSACQYDYRAAEEHVAEKDGAK